MNYIQNHDQIANGLGLRFHQQTSPGRARAMSAVLLLMPGTPMLFQGQEYWASTPFLFFADHKPELAGLVANGRGEFLSPFPNLATDEMVARLPDPADPETFRSCRLDRTEITRNASVVALHRDLMRLRREDPVISGQGRWGIDGAVLAFEAFVLRYFAENGCDRLLLVDFGLDLDLSRAPEPLLASPEGRRWRLLWSSEHPDYGGTGTQEVEQEKRWFVTGHSAVVMAAVEEPRPGVA